jgi:hypothetical protein
VDTSCVRAIAHAVDAAIPETLSQYFPALPSFEHLLNEPGGRQSVVFRGNGASIQISVEGADIAAGPVAMSFLIDGLDALNHDFDRLTTLRRIISCTSRAPVPPQWTAKTMRLRDALITLDGRVAGATYYEIAIMLYGSEYVESNWETGLKDRMRRHFRRGRELSNRGYRELLR